MPDFCARIGVAILLWYRKRKYGCAFRKIKLTRGKYAKVSPEDFEEINSHKWQAVNSHNDTFYAYRMIRINGVRKRLWMHREIMKLPPFDSAQGRESFVVDHGDGDGLNNTRENLSIVTAAENSYNRRKLEKTCTSKYKGVTLDKRRNKYRAQITFRGVVIRLGSFDNETEAAKAYDDAAKELFREYAKLNFG